MPKTLLPLTLLDIESRLANLGIVLPPLPIPQGSYIPAVRTGNLIYISGQLPMREGKMIYSGKVGKDLDINEGQEAAKICFLNIVAALLSAGITLDSVTRVVRLGGFVQSADTFTEQPKVINGASELCTQIFGEIGSHARAAVGVNALPLNAAVEIEALFEIRA